MLREVRKRWRGEEEMEKRWGEVRWRWRRDVENVRRR